MKTKKGLTLLLFTAAIGIAVVVAFSGCQSLVMPAQTASIKQFESLRLNQGETFMALSRNNNEAYDRWVVFYFAFETRTFTDDDTVVEFFTHHINRADLFDDKGDNLLSTDHLIWSAGKHEENLFHLTLILVPDFDELLINKQVQVKKLALSIHGTNLEFFPSNYIIEEQDTLDISMFYTARTPIIIEFPTNLKTELSYGIAAEDHSLVQALDLIYPKGFANLEAHTYIGAFDEAETTYMKGDDIDRLENVLEYVFDLSFSAHNSKVIFRPFIEIRYNGGSGFIIPSVPVYIE